MQLVVVSKLKIEDCVENKMSAEIVIFYFSSRAAMMLINYYKYRHV